MLFTEKKNVKNGCIALCEVWMKSIFDIISKNERTCCTLKSSVLGINLFLTDKLKQSTIIF